jgi:lipopolysaccharide export system protein LptA
MKIVERIVLTSVLSLAVAVPVLPHHSAAAYNTQQEITVKGTVAEYQFKNPHIYMTVNVKKDDGSTALMEIEAGAASVLNPLGFTKDSLKLGE